LVATVGYLIIGAPAVALLGFLTAFAGLIPAIGTALVWLPMGIAYLLQQSYYKGGFILIWGTLVVGVMDNFLRPYLVGTKIDLPFLVLFFALFGGIAIWGFKGILLGPLFMGLVPVLMEEYRKRFASTLEESDK
jgi:predicted PurR-regulated permease PerM